MLRTIYICFDSHLIVFFFHATACTAFPCDVRTKAACGSCARKLCSNFGGRGSQQETRRNEMQARIAQQQHEGGVYSEKGEEKYRMAGGGNVERTTHLLCSTVWLVLVVQCGCRRHGAVPHSPPPPLPRGSRLFSRALTFCTSSASAGALATNSASASLHSAEGAAAEGADGRSRCSISNMGTCIACPGGTTARATCASLPTLKPAPQPSQPQPSPAQRTWDAPQVVEIDAAVPQLAKVSRPRGPQVAGDGVGLAVLPLLAVHLRGSGRRGGLQLGPAS